MKQRRQIGIFTIVLIGVGVGLLIKNVRIGLLIGLGLGLFAGSLIRNR